MPFSICVIAVHPNLGASRANKAILNEISQLSTVDIFDLYDAYPDFKIDAEQERRRLESYDIIVLQMPLYWYGGPSLLKEWMDKTFIPGWAFEDGGDALKDKLFLISTTTGADEASFSSEGINGATLEQSLLPFRQFSQFCGMKWGEPLACYEASTCDDTALQDHAKFVRKRMVMLSTNAGDLTPQKTD